MSGADREDENPEVDRLRLEFDREKHRDDLEFRYKELSLRELKERRAVWHNPLFLALLAAIIGLLSNATVAWFNGRSQRVLEDKKAEAVRILEALRTGDPDVAAENLTLLVEAGLVSEHAAEIRSYLANRQPGEGARLPATTALPSPSKLFAPFGLSTDSRHCEEYLRYGNPGGTAFCRVGYAFGFNPRRRLADWVIYRLAANRKNPPRPRDGEQWYLDPEIPAAFQAGLDAYSGNEWDRGNLVRRTDATWSEEAYREIWLYSVTAPQHQDLNRGLWSILERATTEAIESGEATELFVIAGPVYGPNTIKNYRNVVDIPDGFFRIAYDPVTDAAAAWVVPNGPIDAGRTPVADRLREFLVSINHVEELTGLDFLNELPDTVEEQLESAKVIPPWLQ